MKKVDKYRLVLGVASSEELEDPTEKFLWMNKKMLRNASKNASIEGQKIVDSIVDSGKKYPIGTLFNMVVSKLEKKILNSPDSFSGFLPKKATVERRKRKYPFSVYRPYVAGNRSKQDLFFNRLSLKEYMRR